MYKVFQKRRSCLFLLLYLLSGNLPAVAAEVAVDDDFTPGLFIGVMMVILVLLFSIGIGLAVGAAILLIATTATALGIISTSAFIAFYYKSLKSGIKAFVLISSTIAGVPMGTGVLFALQHIGHSTTTLYSTIIAGTACGLTGGLLGGIFMFRGLSYLVVMLKHKTGLS